MIETIPNPLTDKGVREDIHRKVDEIMDSPLRTGGLSAALRNALVRAAEWGMSEGFRMGWKIHEVRSKRPGA